VVRRLHDIVAGRVVVEARPIKRADAYAKIALAAMGKSSMGRSLSVDPVRALDAWLHGERIRDLFVLRAHTDRFNITESVRLSDQLDLRVWLFLAAERIPIRTARELENVPHTTLSFAEFQDLHQSVRPSAPLSLPRGDYPCVPDDDVWTFLDACAELVPTGRLSDRVRRSFEEGRQAIMRWLPENPHPIARRIALVLRSLADATQSADEAIARLRGAQAAFFAARWYMTFSVAAVRASFKARPRGLDDHTVALLRTVPDPYAAALGLLAVSRPVTRSQLADITVDACDPQGRFVNTAGGKIDIPEAAAGILRAHLRWTRRGKVNDALPLFGPDPWHGPDIGDYLESVGGLCGLTLEPHWDTVDREAGERAWLTRHGVRLVPL
jgi:hypothetical protein